MYSSCVTPSRGKPWNDIHTLGIHTRLKVHVHTEKILVTRGIVHGIPLVSVA